MTQTSPTQPTEETRKREAFIKVLKSERSFLETAFMAHDPFVKQAVSELLVSVQLRIESLEEAEAESIPVRPAFPRKEAV